MSATPEPVEDFEKSPNPFLTKTFIISAAFVALVLLCGVITAIVASSRDQPNGGVTSTLLDPCDRPQSTATDLSGAITVDSWDLVGLTAAPTTPFGPSRDQGGARVCFEHSPAGAAVAASHIAALGSNGQGTLVLEELSADTDARDAALDTMPSEESIPDALSTPVAAQINDYTGDDATVTVALDVDGRTITATYQLVWDGDWKWDVPTNAPTAAETSTLTGFNRFETKGADSNG